MSPSLFSLNKRTFMNKKDNQVSFSLKYIYVVAGSSYQHLYRSYRIRIEVSFKNIF